LQTIHITSIETPQTAMPRRYSLHPHATLSRTSRARAAHAQSTGWRVCLHERTLARSLAAAARARSSVTRCVPCGRRRDIDLDMTNLRPELAAMLAHEGSAFW
jgi:hypothetical protein